METKKYKISGMSCQHCVMAINKELQKLQIEDKKTEIGSAEITFDEQKLTEKEIISAIEEAGYKVIN
ncbi:MAG: copper resistance protein CopZ [Ignavibacteriales bacterium CG_4_9_14_3_um_filter_34_10]|nr:MAG: copper resistance protein CopZ [Ignavibacteriales bacterium CG_4_9_14_3_um_filter_34_10]